MNEVRLTPELLASVAGVLMSLLAAYMPGFSDWFDALDSNKKRLVMAGLLLVSSLAALGLSCAGWFDPVVTCDQAGIETVVWSFILAMMANQATYSITTASSKARKEKRALARARKGMG